MSMQILKNLTVVVGISVAGIVLSFGMSIYTAVQDHRASQAESANPSIPLPAR